jgi:hypothetical protein
VFWTGKEHQESEDDENAGTRFRAVMTFNEKGQ